MADPMNLSPENAANVRLDFADKFYTEWARENLWKPYMGTDEGAIIQVKEDLTRQSGDNVQYAFVNRLVGAGVRGHQVLRGNEEILGDRYMRVMVDVRRHAVAIDKWTAKKSTIDKLQAGKAGLRGWADDLFRADLIDAFQSVNGVAFRNATDAQKNTWMTDNADRVQFGDKMSYTAAGNMATSLANLTSTTGRMTRRTLGLAKRRAQQAKPRIKPVRIKGGGQEWFVAILGPQSFRDLYDDPEMRQDLSMAADRGKDNPLFTGGDLITQGIIVKEEFEFKAFANSASAPIEQNVLLGAQAVGYAVAERFQFNEDTYDYNFETGIGCETIYGQDKLRFSRNADPTQQGVNLVDHGVYTIFTSAPNDV
jgi:hypothetical protein